MSPTGTQALRPQYSPVDALHKMDPSTVPCFTMGSVTKALVSPNGVLTVVPVLVVKMKPGGASPNYVPGLWSFHSAEQLFIEGKLL